MADYNVVREKFREHIETLVARFLVNSGNRDASACAAAYSADAQKFNLGGVVVEGRAAIEQNWRDLFDEGEFVMTDLVPLQCEADGSVGFATVLVKATNGEFVIMLGLRQDWQGAWKIATEVING